MNKNITFALYGAIGMIGGLAMLSLIEFLVGGFGITLISLVVAGFLARKIYDEMFGDLDDDDLVDDLS